MKRISRHSSGQRGIHATWITFAVCMAVALSDTEVRASDYYWDTNGTATGLGSATTPANWSGSFWNTDSTGGAGGTVTTWPNSASNNAFLAGTSGTINIDSAETTGVTIGTLTVNTDGYQITSAANAQQLTATSLVTANNVGLTFNLNDTTGSTWTLGGASLGTSSTLTIQGTATSSKANRVNLTGSVSGGSIVINPSGAGVTGFVATAKGVSIATPISNSSNAATMIGATSGNDITLASAAVISGSAGLQFGAGASGGSGVITLNSVSTYTGATIFNAAVSATIKLGVTNALSTKTDVTMANSSSNGGILDLNGHDQEIASLTSGAGGGSITNGGSSGTNTLMVSGSKSPAAFGLVISDGINAKTALTRSGTGTLILSGANTYTGATTVSGGMLSAADTAANKMALGGTTQIYVNNGGTLLMGAGNQVNTSAPISIGSATGTGTAKLDAGGFSQGTQSTVGLGALTLTASSTIDLTGTSVLHFAASSTATAGAILSILDWNGTATTGGGSELIKFGSANTDLGYVSQIQFVNPTGFAAGTYGATFATGDAGEIVPGVLVPEPATVAGGLLMIGALGWSLRRRLLPV